MIIALLIVLAVAVVIAFILAVGRMSSRSDELSESIRSLNQDVEVLKSLLSERLSDMDSRLDSHLSRTGMVIGDVRQSLGRLEEMTRSLQKLAADISSLQEILKPPSVRGGLGETMLSSIMQEIMPAQFYKFQYRLPNGARVDAAIFVKNKILPVDAKFPLENFRKMLNSTGSEREKYRRAFLNDVKKHIDDISDRYVRPDLGTFDFAIMYIPAEGVYYEAFIRNHEAYEYALKKKVIPTSSGTFYAYLNAVLHSLRGAQLQEHIERIVAETSRLAVKLAAIQKELDTLGEHIRRSANRFESVRKNFGEAVLIARRLSKGGYEDEKGN